MKHLKKIIRLAGILVIILLLTGLSIAKNTPARKDTLKGEQPQSQTTCNPENGLTVEQKVEDFEYLYNTLKENFPYFEMIKRKYGYDWLAHKQEFVEAVKAAPDNKAFFDTLNVILSKLHQGHTNFIPTVYYDFFKQTYTQVSKGKPLMRKMLKPWLKTFNDPLTAECMQYWDSVIVSDTLNLNEMTKEYLEKNKPVCKVLKDGEVIYVKIPSFVHQVFHGENYNYSDTILDFIKKHNTAKTLILDIQGNSGGNSMIWQRELVPPLMTGDITYTTYGAVRDGQLVKEFYGFMLKLAKTKNIPDLPALPPEVKDTAWHYVFIKSKNVFKASKHPVFNGKIYLLVDSAVYSSSEKLAYFAKVSGWATVAGQNTRGDGVGSDPIVATLPNSRLIFRFAAVMGFNPDGSLNDEYGTKPDIFLDGKTPEQRLQQLLDRLGR